MRLSDMLLMTIDNKPFPYVVDQQSGNKATSTTATIVNIPASRQSGDVILICCGAWANQASSFTTPPSGWTMLTPPSGQNSLRWLGCIYKVSDGTETFVTINGVGVYFAAWNCFVIRGGKTINSSLITTSATGRPSSPLLSITGEKNRLWISVGSQHSLTAAQSVLSGWSGFGQSFNTLSSADSPRTFWCTKNERASTLTPPQYPTSISGTAANIAWAAVTVSISP